MENYLNQDMEYMRITIKLERKDIFWFSLSSLWYGQPFFIIVSGLLFILGFIFSITQPSAGKIILFTPILLIAITLLSSFLTGEKSAEKHGIRIYTINQDGISFVSSELQASIKWSNISKVVQTKNYIYLFLSAFTAYVLPMRTISEEQLKEFIGYIPSTVKIK